MNYLFSDFSFSHNVYKRLVRQPLENQGLVGKGLKKQEFIAVVISLQHSCSRHRHFMLQHAIGEANLTVNKSS